MQHKQTIWVLYPSKNNPLSYAQLLVYSYLAHKDSFGEAPSVNQVAWATGLSKETVYSAKAGLKEFKLLDSQDNVLNKPEYWSKKNDGTADGHWVKSCRFWKYYVPSHDGDIAVTMAMTYSYLYCKAEEGFAPRHGWSAAYLQEVLLMDRRTITKALERLQTANLFKVSDEGEWVVRKPNTKQQENFKDKYQRRVHSLRLEEAVEDGPQVHTVASDEQVVIEYKKQENTDKYPLPDGEWSKVKVLIKDKPDYKELLRQFVVWRYLKELPSDWEAQVALALGTTITQIP